MTPRPYSRLPRSWQRVTCSIASCTSKWLITAIRWMPCATPCATSLATLQPRETTIPLYSTVTGGRRVRQRFHADYWWQNVRQPVHFAPAMHTLLADQHHTFVEVGPHPVLHNVHPGSPARPQHQRGRRGLLAPRTSRAREHVARPGRALHDRLSVPIGVPWYAQSARYVKLPTYPWQREYLLA